MTQNKITYKDSGVDVEKGNQFIDAIKEAVQKTKTDRVLGSIGGFAGLYDLSNIKIKNPVLVSATDGVGTKLKVAIDADYYEFIGQDLVAMCVNDILTNGAEPLFFLDYYATSNLDVKSAQRVVKSIADACLKCGASLIGGETAEMPQMYKKGDFDLAGFAVGIVDKELILPQKNITKGDVVIGIESSGLHSNGFSLVRKIIDQHNIDITSASPFEDNKKLYESLLVPTHLYVDSLLPIIRSGICKGLAHITGGGVLENIPRILPKDCDIKYDFSNFPKLPVYDWLFSLNKMDDSEKYKTFNCGVGMAVVVSKEDADMIIKLLEADSFKAGVIGDVINCS